MAFRMSEGVRDRLLGDSQNIINNGTFTTDTTGWSSTQATLSSVAGGQANNCLRVTNSSSAAGYASQNMTVKPGHGYVVRVYSKLGTSASAEIKLGTAADDATYGTKTVSNGSWTEHLFYVEPTTTTLVITLKNTSTTSSQYTDFDEVQVLWNSKGLKDIFKNSKLFLYSGSQPASANDSPSGTLLVSISTAGSGNYDLILDSPDLGVITKQQNATWSGTAVATGTAGWFRLAVTGDSGASSSTDCRIDGAIATSSAELNMASTSIVTSSVQTISVFQLTIPATIV